MNFYRISMSYDDESLEDGIGWENEILSHNEKYTNEEFREICNMAKIKSREKHNEVLLYYMVEMLVKYFGFKKLEMTSSFDFHEEY